MGKVIRFVIPFCVVLLVGGFLLYKMTVPSWVYDLPNDYRVRKTSDSNVVVGLEIEGDFYTMYQDRQVGVEEYVAEFQYNDEFVGVKSLKVKGEDVQVLFYLINTKEREVHGPYMDEESYLAVTGVWSKETLGEWFTTTEVPVGAYFK